jgi:membrane protease subunit (stomatin/prohibitin family)
MGLGDFLRKQFIDVIHWSEPEDGILAYRFPMQDMEIQYGAQLTVRESQAALFVNEGIAADAFGPGRYLLETSTLPILTNLKSWMYGFESPFKSDVYFFSTRQQLDQRWGTQQPITIRDKEFGAIRLRGFGTFSYHIADVKLFHQKVSGTRELYRVGDLDGQLRATIVANAAQAFADSNVPFLDMAANGVMLGERIRETLAPHFAALGLALDTFVVESLSLPEELQKRLDARGGMAILGDMDKYTRMQAADALGVAAANEGGGAGAGMGLGAGIALGQTMASSLQRPAAPAAGATAGPGGAPAAGAAGAADAPEGETKFCLSCGTRIARRAKFCPECGESQA